jgi:integrase/recombinase XerC
MKSREIVIFQPVAAELPATADNRAVLDAFLEGRNENTLVGYRRDLLDFARFLGLGSADNPPAAAVDALLALGHGEANRVALKYVAHLKGRKLAPATICRRLAALRSMVKFGRMIGRVAWSIDVEGPDVQSYRDTRGPGQDGYMSMWNKLRGTANDDPDELERMRAKRDLAMTVLMRDLALRRGSCAALELADVNLDDEPPTIEYAAKRRTDKERKTLPRQVRDILREWLAVRGDEPGPFFVRLDRADNGEMQHMDGESINRIVRRAGVRAGLKRRTNAHGLRHQSITRLLEKNKGNIPEAQALSGHLDPRTVMKYLDNLHDMAGKAAQTLADDYDQLGPGAGDEIT